MQEYFMGRRRVGLWLLGSSVSFLFWGCAPSRFLAPQDRLVAREPILRGHVLPETPPLYIRSNSRTLGMRLGLQFYLGGQVLLYSEKEPWRTLRRLPKIRYYTYALGKALQDPLGEAPTLLSQRAVEQDVALLDEAYLQEGYFQAAIQPQIRPIRAQEVQVIYRIRPGPRWYIREFDLVGKDSVMVAIAEAFLRDKILPVNAPFRLKQLDAFREELHQRLLAEGYYGLPLSALVWEVDTSSISEKSTASAGKGFLRQWLGGKRSDAPTCIVRLVLPEGYRRYKVSQNELTVRTADRPAEWESVHAGVQVRSEPRALRILDPRVLIGQLYVPDGPYYDQRAVQASQRALQSIEAVQWVGTAVEEDSVGALRVRYETVLRPPLDVALSVEGFQSTQPLAGNLALPGASLNLRTTYFSLARRGWSLRTQGQAALSYFRQKPDAPPVPLYNLAAEVGLQFPQSSWRLAEAQPRPLPATLTHMHHALLLSYQDIRQIAFSRRYATFSWSRHTRFSFRDKRQEEQVWTPFGLTFVESRFSPEFEAQIEALSPQVRTLILRDYLPRLTQVTAWRVSTSRDYFQAERAPRGEFASLLLEFGGWLPFFLEHFLVIARSPTDSTYRDNLLLNRFRYGVFGRALGEVRRRYRLLSPKQQLYLRGRVGIAQGLFYTLDVPFENRFFVGGPNSMRAWQFGALGPGGYAFPENLFLIPGGTLLLEANAEVRQSLFRGLQLAPFVDVGNVWFTRGTFFEDPRGYISKRPLPAIGIGIGLRWDFSVLVVRLDIAQQVFEPATGWIFHDFPIGGARSQYVFAVGYPF